ncbi:hypothetical protein Leryth_022305 [Lithospermum erythrorhizon]|nr:hypothetical protein Leryth_022305 [Lithospermum erythrorhizon]
MVMELEERGSMKNSKDVVQIRDSFMLSSVAVSDDLLLLLVVKNTQLAYRIIRFSNTHDKDDQWTMLLLALTDQSVTINYS